MGRVNGSLFGVTLLKTLLIIGAIAVLFVSGGCNLIPGYEEVMQEIARARNEISVIQDEAEPCYERIMESGHYPTIAKMEEQLEKYAEELANPMMLETEKVSVWERIKLAVCWYAENPVKK